MLLAHGYDVRTLNTVDFSLSMRYNPLAYVRTQQDVLELVECLIVNITPKGKSANDPFWENSERLLYCALIGYLTYHCPPEDRTLPGLMTLLSLAEARDEDESFMSPLDVLFRELETGCRCVAVPGGEAGDGHSMGGGRGSVRWVSQCEPATPDSDYALGRYKAFKAAAGKTLKSIIVSCNARLLALASEELRAQPRGVPLRQARAPDARGHPRVQQEGARGEDPALLRRGQRGAHAPPLDLGPRRHRPRRRGRRRHTPRGRRPQGLPPKGQGEARA